MARNRFGGTTNDFVIGPGGAPVANVTATSVTYVDGTPCTDLTDPGGNPIALPTTDSRGFYDFQGPDDDTDRLLVDFGAGALLAIAYSGVVDDVHALEDEVGVGGYETTTGAQAKADAAQQAAEDYSDTQLGTHEADPAAHSAHLVQKASPGDVRTWWQATFPTVADGLQVGDYLVKG